MNNDISCERLNMQTSLPAVQLRPPHGAEDCGHIVHACTAESTQHCRALPEMQNLWRYYIPKLEYISRNGYLRNVDYTNIVVNHSVCLSIRVMNRALITRSMCLHIGTYICSSQSCVSVYVQK